MEKKETEIEKKNDAASKFENDPKRNEETKRARGKNDEEGGTKSNVGSIENKLCF